MSWGRLLVTRGGVFRGRAATGRGVPEKCHCLRLVAKTFPPSSALPHPALSYPTSVSFLQEKQALDRLLLTAQNMDTSL